MENMKNKGRIHSLQSMGAVDGPGLRYCIFLQGCPLRCMYCHNPDTWVAGGGSEYSTDELVAKILRYKTYFTGGGGVTVSGGEPLMQAEFVTELFTKLHEAGIHTCLDTSGNFPEATVTDAASTINTKGQTGEDATATINAKGQTGEDATATINAKGQTGEDGEIPEKFRKLLAVTDLCICDIKFTTEDEYRLYTGGSLKKVLRFLKTADNMNVDLWVRHVIVPGFTDTEEEVLRMSAIAHRFGMLKKIELLPFHKLCIPKYEALNIPFKCRNIDECTTQTIEKLSNLIDTK